MAAAILASAGLRVSLFDRARFPRHKLCGDTLNPGALAVVRRHADAGSLIAASDAIDGMLLTGPGGVRVRGEYGGGVSGRSITRKVLDQWLIDRAVEAGAAFHDQTMIGDVLIRDGRAAGIVTAGRGGRLTHPARLVIAADGRRSAIAIGRGIARQPARPRRWAIGAYYEGVADITRLGEMHVRRGHYIGVAPVPGGLANACLVVPHLHGDVPITDPGDALDRYLQSDAELSPRFANARRVAPPTMLGPMAIDAAAAGEPGLLLAGDAAGFIDPMTGDGLHFAFRGAELAAAVVTEVFAGALAIDRAHLVLAERRRQAFQSKWRFNRALRSLVSSPSGVSVAAATARVLPSLFHKLIEYAGDCGPAPRTSVRVRLQADP